VFAHTHTHIRHTTYSTRFQLELKISIIIKRNFICIYIIPKVISYHCCTTQESRLDTKQQNAITAVLLFYKLIVTRVILVILLLLYLVIIIFFADAATIIDESTSSVLFQLGTYFFSLCLELELRSSAPLGRYRPTAPHHHHHILIVFIESRRLTIIICRIIDTNERSRAKYSGDLRYNPEGRFADLLFSDPSPFDRLRRPVTLRVPVWMDHVSPS